MLNNNSNEYADFFQLWLSLKKSKDYSFYKFFLNELRKEFSKLYLELTNEETLSVVKSILDFATCELKEIRIKYKKSNVMKDLKDMTDQELLTSWNKGSEWLSERMDKNDISDEKWDKALKRIEVIEVELKRRGVKYGKQETETKV